MSTMNNSSKNSKQVARRSEYNLKDINRIMRPAKPRDDLHGAFAGNENKNSSASTHVKSRKTEKSKSRTPVM